MTAIDTAPLTAHLQGENGSFDQAEDPFVTNSSPINDQRRTSHRYSAFDTHLFSQSQSSASPAAAKRALEAHIIDTDRRLKEAGELGQALVRQRDELFERLKEVEQQKGEREIGPELRQKLTEVEREYNELGRESARTFLAPKARHLPPEDSGNGNITLDSRVCAENPHVYHH